MASKSLTFDIFGRDRSASRTMNTIGQTAVAAGRRVALAAAAIAAAIAVVVVRFGIDSVKAAAEAETAQMKLTDAWAKFPKTADLAIDALRDYNSELAKTTRFDDDAIASGQAVLAQFKLTGQQIQRLTPLLLDYAAKTGKDLPTAAQDLGKALLGQGRALKAIGINFKDTGTLAGNFELIVASLTAKVGGFAEKEGTTAAGKLEILKNRFGEVQEAIGFALMPALSDLLDFTNETVLPGLEDFSAWFTETGLPAIKDIVAWIVKYKDILGPTAVALGVLTAAQWALNAAMFANPVGLIILGVAALIALVAALATNFMGLRTSLLTLQVSAIKALASIGVNVAMAMQGAMNAVIDGINGMLRPLNNLLRALGLAALSLPKASFGNAAKTAYGNLAAYSNIVLSGGKLGGGTTFGGHGGITKFADGGVVRARPGGTLGLIGEAGSDEAVVPLDRWGGLGGGTTVYVTVPAGFVGDENKLAQTIVRTLDRAKGRGAIPRTALS